MWQHRRRRAELTDPPRLRNEFPLTRAELRLVAFMFAGLALVAGTAGRSWTGVLLVASVGVIVYSVRTEQRRRRQGWCCMHEVGAVARSDG